MNKFITIAIATFIVIGCQSQRSPEKAIANCEDDGEFIVLFPDH